MLAIENDRNLEQNMWIKKEKLEVILMDSSKAFNTINHSLLLEKLGFLLDRKNKF